MSDAPLGRCIGLIGGLGVGRALNLVMVHAQVDRVLGAVGAGDKQGLASYLADLIARLRAAGAEFAVVPAVAPHIAIEELIQASPLPIVNLIAELRRVALFGTRFAVESQLFGHLGGVEVITPHPDEVDFIHTTYLQLVGAGVGLATQRDGLSRLAHKLIERDRVESVILAGTELALVFDENNTDFPHINCAALHLNAILRRAMEAG